MVTNPHAKRVLCFGNSNTYGQRDNLDFTAKTGRYPANVRWTGVLQNLLGEEFEIIEEGLGGRLTDISDINAGSGPKLRPPRNGLTYFESCVHSHAPLDLIILLTGANDCKLHYGRNAEDIAHAIGRYVEYTTKQLPETELLIVSPPAMNEKALAAYPNDFDERGIRVSEELFPALVTYMRDEFPEYYRTMLNVYDAGNVADVGDDGVHLTQLANIRLGSSLAEMLRLILRRL